MAVVSRLPALIDLLFFKSGIAALTYQVMSVRAVTLVSVRNRRASSAGVLAIAMIAALLDASTSASISQPRNSMALLAVFPVENLTGGAIPGGEVRQYLIDRIESQGIRVLGAGRLEAFLTKHRVRYTGGVDAPTAELMRQEIGVDGIVLASMDLSIDSAPPKVALVVRLISTKAEPIVVWAYDAGSAGDDAPGLFELGMVNDYQKLFTRAVSGLTNSLVEYLRTGETKANIKRASKFRPKSVYRNVTLDPGRTYSVAVLPFVNISERRNAGELLALLFMRHLADSPQFRVVDCGVVRRQLLDTRIIMDGGPSIADAETIAAVIDADFVLGGRVTRYEDFEGAVGRTRVEFSTVLIERKSRRIVWSSDSYNDGLDGVRFFERGASKTAHAMATQMVRLTTEMIAGREH